MFNSVNILSSKLQKALAQLPHLPRRTSIIITHRFTTAMHADVIHVMDRGRIVESGSHQRLLEQCGLYAASWSRQNMLAAGASR